MKSELTQALEKNNSGVLEGNFSTNLTLEVILEYLDENDQNPTLEIKLSEGTSSLGTIMGPMKSILNYKKRHHYIKDKGRLQFSIEEERVHIYLYYLDNDMTNSFGRFLATTA
jgi:hypothetical protein